MSFKKTVDLLADGKKVWVNCRICGGQLVSVPAAAELESNTPAGIIYACHAESADRFFVLTSTHAYVSGDGGYFIMLNPLAGSSPFLIEDIDGGKARAVLINGVNAVRHNGSSFMAFKYGADLCCGVMHCGRLFGVDSTDRLLLRWSGEKGLQDWEQGIRGSGSLKLDPGRGAVLDMVKFGEKLVLVRKFGLTVLSMFGSPENFSVENTDTDTDEIYKGTARVVCGRLLFFSASGLHSFDGSLIKGVPHCLSEDISAPVCSAVCDGKYYLGCHSHSLNKSVVLCYDAQENESWIIDVAADSMCAAECVYVYNGSGAYRLSDGGEFSLTCAEIDFGTDNFKTVTRVTAKGGADVEINNGRISRRFCNVDGTVRPNLRGRRFTVKVTGKGTVSNLTAAAEVCNAI